MEGGSKTALYFVETCVFGVAGTVDTALCRPRNLPGLPLAQLTQPSGLRLEASILDREHFDPFLTSSQAVFISALALVEV